MGADDLRPEPLPSRAARPDPLPSRAARPDPLPSRAARPEPLPVRTSRSRRPGRHSSPHQLSVPAEAPALILAMPGSASASSQDLADSVAATASTSCPGVTVRAGFLEGSEMSLRAILATLRSDDGRPAAVVVPLLVCPLARADQALAAEVATAPVPVLVTGHLGPHPLLAGALHTRLAEAGLARGSRAGRLNIASPDDGLVVAAAGDPQEAQQAAGALAVLLAARLTLPVAAASLGDAASVAAAVARLEDARVTRMALAPCVIGPEISLAELAAATAGMPLEAAGPLGPLPAIGQIVAMRYGTALQDPQLAGVSG